MRSRSQLARPRCRAVAFDLGGVLYDVDVARGARQAARALGIEPQHLERAVFGAGLWQRLEVGAVDGDIFLREVLAQLGLPASRAHREGLLLAWCAIIQLRDGVGALLEAVRPACLVWSNTDPLHAGLVRSAPALATRIARWSVSFELGVEKPCALFFARALAQAALEPWQVVYVDDRSENVAQACALGVDAFVARSLAGVRAGLLSRRLLLL
jgi:FMN phosphatase YigB (HAD superfamily)